MILLKKLSRSIPSSPYSWKNTSEKRRGEIISTLVKKRQEILQMNLPKLIEGELYIIDDGNDFQVYEALRVIKEVLSEKYRTLKDE